MADLYNLSPHSWGGNVISLHADASIGDMFATVPLNFLRGSGLNSWEYVIDLAGLLVDPVAAVDFISQTCVEIRWKREARSALDTTYTAAPVRRDRALRFH